MGREWDYRFLGNTRPGSTALALYFGDGE